MGVLMQLMMLLTSVWRGLPLQIVMDITPQITDLHSIPNFTWTSIPCNESTSKPHNCDGPPPNILHWQHWCDMSPVIIMIMFVIIFISIFNHHWGHTIHNDYHGDCHDHYVALLALLLIIMLYGTRMIMKIIYSNGPHLHILYGPQLSSRWYMSCHLTYHMVSRSIRYITDLLAYLMGRNRQSSGPSSCGIVKH